MSGSVRQFEKCRAEIPDAASPKRLHQNPQHQPQQPPRKWEGQGQAANPLSATNRHRGANRCSTKTSKSHRVSPQGSSPKAIAHSRGTSPLEQRPATGKAQQQAKPTTRIAVPDTRQRGNPNPHQGQKAESTHRNKAAPAIHPRAPHSDSLKTAYKSSIITDTGHSFRESYNSTSQIQNYNP